MAAAKTPNWDREFDETPEEIPAFRANPCWKNPEFDDANNDLMEVTVEQEGRERQNGWWVRLDLEKSKSGEVRFEEQGMDAIVECMITENRKLWLYGILRVGKMVLMFKREFLMFKREFGERVYNGSWCCLLRKCK